MTYYWLWKKRNPQLKWIKSEGNLAALLVGSLSFGGNRGELSQEHQLLTAALTGGQGDFRSSPNFSGRMSSRPVLGLEGWLLSVLSPPDLAVLCFSTILFLALKHR